MTSFGMTGGDKLDAKLSDIASKVARFGLLRVGFLEDKEYPDGTPVAQVAAINNFGAPGAGIPARPFFTKMIQEKSPGWGEALAKIIDAIGWDAQTVLSALGQHLANQLVESIDDMNDPANSPVTNLLKQRFPMGGYGFDDVLSAWGDSRAAAAAPAGKPLVWTGLMRNSVSFEVTPNDG